MIDLIDYAYCRTHHGFADDAAVDAWFAKEAPGDLRTFSGDFSPVDYLLMNDDVRRAGVNPIKHYLAHGFSEGREIRPAPSLRAYAGASAAPPAPDARVAFVLHLYYPSFVPIFLDRLGHVDFARWDVFISTSEEVAAAHGDALRAALGERLRALRPVPNRGRNFAPLFVDFAGDLADYDVICHCHSKESRYSGRRQTEWADYLIGALMGAPDTMRRHVDLLMSGGCEAVAPAPFAGMPPWASHSLSNEAQLRALCRRLDVDASTGFMAYPIGGMLWMTRALHATVLRLGLTHDDFPHEPSRPDGELHHALERLIGRIAGERMAFFDQVTGRYWASDAVLRAEVSRFGKLDDLVAAVEDHDLVSFDFFDTLCVRFTGDEEWAKRRVEFVLGQNYVEHRNLVEARLREKLGEREDVPLSLIAQELAGDGFVDAARAVALERTFDLATLVPRAQVVDAYEAAIESGKTVLIVSDSYYDKGLIRSFLRKHDITEPDEILTSADIGLRKDRGDLWGHLAAIRGLAKALHVGDNIHSDIQKAAEHGFATFYVPHWRQELLPFAGFSQALQTRNLTNPGFARSVDRRGVDRTRSESARDDLRQ